VLSDTTIADVEDTLITLLRNEMADLVPEGEQQIVLLSPAEAVGRQVRLTLFLYAVVETPYLKNEPRHIETTTDEEFSPLALDLYYMLTCYGSEDIPEHDRSLEAHQVLGRAMRVFYDNGILSGSILRGNLADTREELRISLNPITLEDLTRIWSVFPDTPYRTSVSYVVTPVNIRSTRRVREQRVVAKETDVDRMVPRGEGI
jgi:hypothetical protein